MFKITELMFYNYLEETYSYNFVSGINYFKGENNSGKTVFYNLIDYMLGSSKEIKNDEWYKNVKKISMKIHNNGVSYILTRTKNKDENYFTVEGITTFESMQPISYREYKIRLASIFTPNESLLNNIKIFTGQDLTYRTFTIFNFLGEKRQGNIQDFLDKGRDIEYSVKLSSLLNFIFNKNLKRIFELETKLENLEKEVKKLELNKNQYDFIVKEINNNIIILNLNMQYNGKNAELLKQRLEQYKLMEKDTKPVAMNEKNTAELSLMLENIDEQLKIYQSYKKGIKDIEKESNNRKQLLIALDNILKNNGEFSYLLDSIKKLLNELNTTISFSQSSICDKTIGTLQKQRELIKNEIKKNNARFKLYSVQEKEKAVILLENYLKQNVVNSNEELAEKLSRIKTIKEELLLLKNKDDLTKINNLSIYITSLYSLAKDVSDFVKIDTDKSKFKIKYLKKGNILQPEIEEIQIVDKGENKEKTKKTVLKNYYTGSMARHTLIQICGYFGFLKLLIENREYPLIPIFVGDHLSKPFDKKNINALGAILNKVIQDIGKNNIQIFLFDDEEASKLGLNANKTINLIEYDKNNQKTKTGFIPFYKAL